MKSFKILVFALLISAHIMHASEVEYVLSGQEAVLRLTKTGECTTCDLSGQCLTQAFAVLKKQNKKINVAGSDLSACIIRNCNLQEGDNFKNTILDDALLFDVATQGADFTGASTKRMKLQNMVAKIVIDGYKGHPNQKLYAVK